MAEEKPKEEMILRVRGLKKYFPITKGLFSRVVGHVKAVDGVNFHINEGEALGLVGESGCGKTTTGRTITRLYKPTAGEILFRLEKGQEMTDISDLDRDELLPFRRQMQMMFQDPFTSLNPRKTILQIVNEPLRINNIGTPQEREDRVAELLSLVGLRPEYMMRYPHAFSGGQRQRIGVARALALNPKFIVADEPVSALDVSVQAQVLNLMKNLQQQLNLTYLFIAHDLSVVKHISDRIAVMYVGKLVETAESDALFQHPLHPYTEALLASVPRPNPRTKRTRLTLPGEVADPANAPPGCCFHPRCRYAQAVCAQEEPELRELAPNHMVACHFAEELELASALEIAGRETVASEESAS
jgi:peptide/nickel transport system ATP-binding protein